MEIDEKGLRKELFKSIEQLLSYINDLLIDYGADEADAKVIYNDSEKMNIKKTFVS